MKKKLSLIGLLLATALYASLPTALADYTPDDTVTLTISCNEHEWDDGVVKTKAVIGAAGETLYTCSLCGETKTEELTIVAQGGCGTNVTYTLDCEGILTISGTGDMRNWVGRQSANSWILNNSPWAGYKENIKYVRIEAGVTSIGCGAFRDCSALTSITIPDSVASIGYYAFYGCSSLNSVVIPRGVSIIDDYVFKSCSSLASITIPDSVTSIGKYAFGNCSSLTRITIPDGVTSIGAHAFYYCSSLTSISIPDGVTSINNGLFLYCSNLTSITIPDAVTSIGNFAFCGCSNLMSISMPDSVTSIGESAFSDCSSLRSITIPDGVTSIGDSTFYGCSGLTNFIIPKDVTYIGAYAFSGCPGLTSITIPSGVTSVGTWAFTSNGSDFSIYLDCDSKIIDTLISDHCESRLIFNHRTVIQQAPIVPTCTTDGLTEGSYCTVCSMVLVTQTVAPALGHVDGTPVVLIEPTETADGVQVIQCVNCKEILRSEAIPATGTTHVPGEANVDGTVDINDALVILRYASGETVSINIRNADVNADGNVDIHDALLILQYDAGWNVTLQ